MKKEDVIKAINRQQPSKIPIWFNYFARETRMKYGEALSELLAQFPDDLTMGFMTDHDWGVCEEHAEYGVGAQVKQPVIDDWQRLPLYLDAGIDKNGDMRGHFPDYRTGNVLEKAKQARVGNPDGFVMGCWWRAYFERLHYLRNMENAFADLLLERDNVNILLDRIDEYLYGMVDRFVSEVGVDGIFFGDDIGMQDRLMMSADTFREIFKPRLAGLIAYCHKKGLYAGMHSCGNIISIIPDFIEIGLDILHPLQPHCVDSEFVVNEYGKDITFFAGVDVQYLLPSGNPQTIDAEIRRMFSLFSRHGGFLCTFANTVMPETPLENIRAALEAMNKYSYN